MKHYSRGVTCWALAVLLLAVLLPGCGGCGNNTKKSQSQKEIDDLKKKLAAKKKPKPKPDYELGRPRTLPHDMTTTIANVYKPGHWNTTSVTAVANNFDFRGEMRTSSANPQYMPFRLSTRQPLLLPKRQVKEIELAFFVPNTYESSDFSDIPSVPLSVRMTPKDSTRTLRSEQLKLLQMPDYQYFFLVLARDVDSYKYLDELDSVQSHIDEFRDRRANLYRVLRPAVTKRAPLPTNALTWTHIAYILWDDMPAEILSNEQQLALVDWLHWGGQLIVSGPGTLDQMQAGFLEPILPAKHAGTIEFSPDQLEAMFKEWTFGNKPVEPVKPWPGQQLTPAADANVLAWTNGPGSIPLIVERNVGRGRIVVTAFQLNQPELRAGRKQHGLEFDPLFNACLLRRPPREFSLDPQGHAVTYQWRENGKYVASRTPAAVSNLRYFSRDTGARTHVPGWINQGTNEYSEYPGQFGGSAGMQFADNLPDGPPVAAWDDFNDVAHLARTSLVDAAGITVPPRLFVVQVLAVYLAVLVPLNWCVFRLLGKVEYAWLAAPVITIVFTISVVRLAQLNIGFADAKTEVAVVEVFGDYPRAHLTRYMALYTSLAAGYDLTYQDATALVLPFPDGNQPLRIQLSTPDEVCYHRRRPIGLEGFSVASNSLGLLHSEQMLDLGGTISLRKRVGTDLTGDAALQVVNDSRFRLENAVIHAPGGRTYRLGTLEPGDARPLEDITAAELEDSAAQGENSPAEASAAKPAPPPNPPIQIDALVKLAARGGMPDRYRLVAQSTDELPGLEVQPGTDEQRQANVFVVHLEPEPRGAPKRDLNQRPALPDVLDGEVFERENPLQLGKP